LLPPDNATGNYTKIVQRIPVKIVLDPDPALCAATATGDVGDRGDPNKCEKQRLSEEC
jgi:multidrug resistance efflux pump